MPKYFFRLSSDDLVPEEGEEFRRPEQMALAALAVARDLAKNKRAAEISGKAVIVTDETGAEVAIAPLVPTS